MTDKKIFLLGMMGTGKTYWSQRLSKMTGLDWIDLDQEIEKITSLSIKEIFSSQGEPYFREKEREALHMLSGYPRLIIATGGGTPCFYDNMEWMNNHGITIWIDEDVDTLVGRLQKEKAHRPLIRHLSDEGLHDFLDEKLRQRAPYYGRAHHHLRGDSISDSSFAEILRKHE